LQIGGLALEAPLPLATPLKRALKVLNELFEAYEERERIVKGR
jgi:hypothetical protein